MAKFTDVRLQLVNQTPRNEVCFIGAALKLQCKKLHPTNVTLRKKHVVKSQSINVQFSNSVSWMSAWDSTFPVKF